MLSIHIGAEPLFHLGPLTITNTLLMSWIVVILLIVAAQVVVRKVSLVPAGFQNVVESGVELLLGFMEKIFNSRDTAEKYFPLIATIFTLVLISNWFGILPGVGSIGFYEVEEHGKVLIPLLRSAASDLNFTLAIAIVSVFMTNFIGVSIQGLRGHLSKFFNFKNPIMFFVGILELMGEFIRMVSFSFRLYGNVFAGEVLLAITGFLLPYVIPVPFLFLELFVGFIQAMVFATLTLVFISIAIEHHA
jgi:F-type H+-transporting ATPase subunit a